MIHDAQKKYPAGLQRGFHSPSNRLDEILDALPRKGKLNRIEREREEAEDFARQQYPAVESAINNLEQRGLDRVRTHGADGFSGRVVDSRAESALGCSDRSGGDGDTQPDFSSRLFRSVSRNRLSMLEILKLVLPWVVSGRFGPNTCTCNSVSR